MEYESQDGSADGPLTLPPSMDALHSDAWQKITDVCFITPAIERLNALTSQDLCAGRERQFNYDRETVPLGPPSVPAMTRTPSTASPSHFEAQQYIDSPPASSTNECCDPVIERIDEILGVVGCHQTIFEEQVACVVSLVEKSMAQIRRLREEALFDITAVMRELYKLRADMVRRITSPSPPSRSPEAHILPERADEKLPLRKTGTYTAQKSSGQRNLASPRSRRLDPSRDQTSRKSGSKAQAHDKQVARERRSEGSHNGSQHAHVQSFHEQAPGAQQHLTSETLGLGKRSNVTTSPVEQRQHEAFDKAQEARGQPAEIAKEHSNGIENECSTASHHEAVSKLCAGHTSPTNPAKPAKEGERNHTADSSSPSLKNSTETVTPHITTALPLSHGPNPPPCEPDCADPVEPCETEPRPPLRAATRLTEPRISPPHVGSPSIQRPSRESLSAVERDDASLRQGTKRRLDGKLDDGRGSTRTRVS